MEVNISEEELRRDLYQLNMTQKEVAEKHNCHRMTVSRRMEEYGLENLPQLRVQKKNSGRTYYLSGDEQFSEYQLVAIADGADPSKVFGGDGQVHHINGCRYDNRMGNIVALTNEEHGLVERGDLEVDKEKGILYKKIE